MEDEAVRELLVDLIKREREDGCCMANESLIGPALRRWKYYDRRHRQSKSPTREARVVDLLKGFLQLFPDHDYDKSCLRHLAESFVGILSVDADANRCHLPD